MKKAARLISLTAVGAHPFFVYDNKNYKKCQYESLIKLHLVITACFCQKLKLLNKFKFIEMIVAKKR